jgi:hypothetical protein
MVKKTSIQTRPKALPKASTPPAEGKNSNLGDAKTNKNDEFYTQWVDIEREMNAYLEYDSDVFRDKVILLPCDDPEWSNFAKFFALHFMDYGIKKLIATSYAPNSKPPEIPYQPTLFESEAPQFDTAKTRSRGKKFVLEAKDINDDGVVNIEDLQWEYLDGDGDFRSPEVMALRDKADIIITNPPFSLFREFLTWIVKAEKEFVIIGNKNAITYKEAFPLIMGNEMWLGSTPMSLDLLFGVPEIAAAELLENGKEGSKWRRVDGKVLARSSSIWFSNLDHGRRHQPLQLMTMADNKKHSKHKDVRGVGYQKYDNYDAVEVPFTDAIPSDYSGLMGVPISFLSKYNPDQFEILGTSDNGLIDDAFKSTPGLTQKFVDDYYKAGGKGAYQAGNPTAGIYEKGIARMVYKRIFIRHRSPAK